MKWKNLLCTGERQVNFHFDEANGDIFFFLEKTFL